MRFISLNSKRAVLAFLLGLRRPLLNLEEKDLETLKLLKREEYALEEKDLETLKLLKREECALEEKDLETLKLLKREEYALEEKDLETLKLLKREEYALEEKDLETLKLLKREECALEEKDLETLKLLKREEYALEEKDLETLKLLKREECGIGAYGMIEGAYGTQISYSQEGEDRILDRIFNATSSGFYVDVGAHHPKRFSNTYYFYRRGWRGINIDPNSGIEELFKAIRPEDIFFSCAVSNISETKDFYFFDESALNTYSRDLAIEYQDLGYKLINSHPIKTKKLSEILSESKFGGKVDFMSIDVEGHELAVLESNDWAEYRPKILLVEILNFNFTEAKNFPVHNFIVNNGYEFFAKTVNTIFYVDKK